MKKILPLIILILVLIFVAFFVYKPKSEVPSTKSTSPGMTVGEGVVEKFSGSLMDLFNSGKAMKCTSTFKTDDGTMSTLAYVSKEKTYAETMYKSTAGEEMANYAIFDGDWMYSWDDTKKGTKMQISKLEELGDDTEVTYDEEEMDETDFSEVDKSVEMDADYSCEPWSVDNSKFSPPADVEFMDFEEMMQQALPEGMPQVDCSLCDELDDAAAAAQCRTALGC